MGDTERVDHGDAIKRHAQRVRSLADAITERAEPMTMRAFGDIEDDTTAIEQHADALAADLARVVAYARMVTAFAREIDRQRGESADAAIAKMQETTGVADLMRDNDGEAR